MELIEAARGCLDALATEVERRRSRDKASTLLTDAYVALQRVGERLAVMSSGWDARGAAHAEEEEEPTHEYLTRQVPLADLMGSPALPDEEEAAEAGRRTVADVRLRHFRSFLEFLVVGCRQVDEVTLKVLAIVRRVRPELLSELGVSQSAVARKIGEKRATTSAREKRVVETLMVAGGARGFHLLGGTKSESHRDKCRAAQRGNGNRRKAEELKRMARGAGEEKEKSTTN